MKVSRKTQLSAVLFVAIGISLIGLFVFLQRSPPRTESSFDNHDTVTLKNQTIRIARADTPEKRARGLGGRSGLAPDEGMLFIYSNDGYYAFWMKDMRFAIDILWLSKDGAINYIQESVAASTYPTSFSPPFPARFVLELPAGYVSEFDVKIGDSVSL